MAGGKETPRQKMIGMMYLFLTAMLAINVSDSLLKRFIFINESLEQAAKGVITQNTHLRDRIEKAVEDGKREEDKSILVDANKVREITNGILSTLNTQKEELVTASGGRDDEGHLLGYKNTESIANIMVRGKGGDKIKEAINAYVDELNALLPDRADGEFRHLALDGKDHPTYKNDPNQKRKPFAELFFENTPLPAAMSSISQLENEILTYESLALEELAQKVGAGQLKFDNIRVMVRPESRVVAAGSKYKAEVFLAASSSSVTPKMMAGGRELNVDSTTGIGTYEFTAQAGEYDDEGNATKKYTAEISLYVPGKGDSTFSQEVEYIVAKPVIQVQSQALKALYLNAGNELSIQVPTLGASYDPKFTGDGGDVIPGGQKGLVTIIPKAAKFAITVINDGNTIGTEEFRVKPIPKPEIKLFNGSKEPNYQQGEDPSRLSSLTIKAIPDTDFAENLPKDARYRVTQWTITLARGSKRVDVVKASGERANIRNLMQQARSGDRLVVEVAQVLRMNFRNETEQVRMTVTPFNLPLK